jgi:flagellar biogenesis protein FliO
MTSAMHQQESYMNISFDKILVVLGFLVVLVAIQFIVKFTTRDLKTQDNNTSKIKLRSRLNLSKNERADLLSVDDKSLLVIFSKGAPPNIVDLTSPFEDPENDLVK